jgi:ribosome biogenesis protein ENP2
MTEELEESKSTNVYDDYKFLTTAELDKLNASHLIGTSMLKAYMHGYFIELKSY